MGSDRGNVAGNQTRLIGDQGPLAPPEYLVQQSF
jgi:hypothetical protein